MRAVLCKFINTPCNIYPIGGLKLPNVINTSSGINRPGRINRHSGINPLYNINQHNDGNPPHVNPLNLINPPCKNSMHCMWSNYSGKSDRSDMTYNLGKVQKSMKINVTAWLHTYNNSSQDLITTIYLHLWPSGSYVAYTSTFSLTRTWLLLNGLRPWRTSLRY